MGGTDKIMAYFRLNSAKICNIWLPQGAVSDDGLFNPIQQICVAFWADCPSLGLAVALPRELTNREN